MKTQVAIAIGFSSALLAFGCVKMDAPQGALDPAKVPSLEDAKVRASDFGDGQAQAQGSHERVLSCATRSLSDAHLFTTVVIQHKKESDTLVLTIAKVRIDGQTTTRENLVVKDVTDVMENDQTETFRPVKSDGTPGDALVTYDTKDHWLQVDDPTLLPFKIDCDTGILIRD